MLLMTTWTRGSRLREQVQCQQMPIDLFFGSVSSVPRVSGTAIFLSRVAEGIPHSLLHNLKHNKVLHERVVLVSLIVEEVPRVVDERQLEIENLGSGMYRIKAHFGYSENPTFPGAELADRQRHAFRHDGYDLVPRSRNRHAHPRRGDGRLARAPVRLDVEERRPRHGLAQAATQSRGRTRHQVEIRAVGWRPARPGSGVAQRGQATRPRRHFDHPDRDLRNTL
ncbi:MAG: KUP/HAK/KT family potassium transporter [Rhodanobacteraceae bacterium]|nr:KUP/HAK/KT family potassium transporter [Rhodanobacteraceae bacterium]